MKETFKDYWQKNKDPFMRGFAVGFLVCLFITEILALHIFS